MKKLVVFLLLTAFTVFLYAQEKNCNYPLSSPQFQQKFAQIKSKPESGKLQFAKQVVKSYCFSSNQIKEIASLFENDYDRYEFAKAAYHSTFDKENFYDVYDAFIYYSVVFRLHDYVKKLDDSGNNQDTESNNILNIEFPNYNYPPFSRYQGNKNCTNLIKSNNFNLIAKKVNSANSENEKYTNAIRLIKGKCMPTAYLMKIASLFTSEENRFKFAKAVVSSVYDLDNYVEMKQIFNTPRARSEFMNFLGNLNTTSNNSSSSNSCKVSNNEYQNIIISIKNEKFNFAKVKTAKHLIQTKKCFTALQIKGIVELFDFESSRIDLAKHAYDFTINQSDYYTTVSQVLGFANSKKQLLDYINNKNQ